MRRSLLAIPGLVLVVLISSCATGVASQHLATEQDVLAVVVAFWRNERAAGELRLEAQTSPHHSSPAVRDEIRGHWAMAPEPANRFSLGSDTVASFQQAQSQEAPLALGAISVQGVKITPFTTAEGPAIAPFNPNGPLTLRLSRPGINPEGTEALVFAEEFCGELCGGGFYVVLEQHEGHWRIRHFILAYVS